MAVNAPRIGGAAPRGKPALRQQLSYIQLDLQAARKNIRVPQEELAKHLGVSARSLRGWEKAHDTPRMEFLIGWAGALGYRFVLAQDGRGPDELMPVCLGEGESWETCEMRRLATTLRNSRVGRAWSQTDLAALLEGRSRSTIERWEDVESWPTPASFMGWAARLDYRLLLVRSGSPLLAPHRHAQRTQERCA